MKSGQQRNWRALVWVSEGAKHDYIEWTLKASDFQQAVVVLFHKASNKNYTTFDVVRLELSPVLN